MRNTSTVRPAFRIAIFGVAVFLLSASVTAAYAVPQTGNSNVIVGNCGSGTARGDSQYFNSAANARTVPSPSSGCNSYRATMRIRNGCQLVNEDYELLASSNWASVTFPANWTNATANHGTTNQGNGAILKRQPYYSAASFESSTGVFHATANWYDYGKASGTCP